MKSAEDSSGKPGDGEQLVIEQNKSLLNIVL